MFHDWSDYSNEDWFHFLGELCPPGIATDADHKWCRHHSVKTANSIKSTRATSTLRRSPSRGSDLQVTVLEIVATSRAATIFQDSRWYLEVTHGRCMVASITRQLGVTLAYTRANQSSYLLLLIEVPSCCWQDIQLKPKTADAQTFESPFESIQY